jgi:hypothetical protein
LPKKRWLLPYSFEKPVEFTFHFDLPYGTSEGTVPSWHEIPKGLFRGIKPERRWDFIANVLNHTTRVKDKLPDSSTVGAPSGEKSIPIVFWARKTINGSAIFSNSLEKPWDHAIDSLGRRNGTRGIYDKVSLEHILRQLVEIDAVREKIAEGRKAVEINRLTRIYKEFAAASAADGKGGPGHGRCRGRVALMNLK